MIKLVEDAYGISLAGKLIGLIPHGIEDMSAQIHPKAPSGNVRIFYAGRHEPRKGIDVLLAVVPALMEEFPKLEFIIAGEDPGPVPEGTSTRARFLSQYRGAPWLSRVSFPGFLNNEDLFQNYADCDIFVAPSRFESFGLVYTEAMMFGKPSVGTNSGGIPEVVTHDRNGLLAEPGDPQSLHAALRKLVANEDLRRILGKNARQDFVEQFTLEQMAKRVADYYREVSNAMKKSRDR
jgi:glycosyltransferase involved in cell wall biosynthesis